MKNNNGEKMNNDRYDEIIKKVIKKENISKNILIAFLSGGLIGVFGEFLANIFDNFMSIEDSYLAIFIVLVVLGSVFTGLGFFDKILSLCKCGLIVPTTGFANTMTSCAMDNNKEGFVKGIGSNLFKLTGSIILYGVIFGIIFGFIRSVI